MTSRLQNPSDFGADLAKLGEVRNWRGVVLLCAGLAEQVQG